MTASRFISAMTLCLVGSTAAVADTAGIHMGLGQWQSDISGSLGGISTDIQNFKKANNGHMYLAVEHPIPLLPNVRLAYQVLEQKGSFFPQGGSVQIQPKIDISHTDATFYYELLDNWISFDLGLGIRRYDGTSTLSAGGVTVQDRTVDVYLPTVYADANFDLPFTGLSVGANLTAGSMNDTEFSEMSARISYMFDGVADLGAELGYKQKDLTRIDGLDLDGDFSGPYLTLKAHF
ncbi:TIGR04219 family outer membrane beta-barrel protein [Simiduia agarivorans]|uniref:Lipoprotein n=1 Tax=Simiduia agarivorans (strain DSM 21679 / JCM 13881 / BCRC 17597 / SA1) TaxID=1117647 RepID=K4KEJ6_SIMAS|nr:TIGR04219 family outer membrane beta-barrel protein [Simiduia agarivorans]AFU97346.1 putative lipoprotein [Simiduia agarivorans SA1 = DSM 21679]